LNKSVSGKITVIYYIEFIINFGKWAALGKKGGMTIQENYRSNIKVIQNNYSRKEVNYLNSCPNRTFVASKRRLLVWIWSCRFSMQPNHQKLLTVGILLLQVGGMAPRCFLSNVIVKSL
jgi:hypothetical protein